MASNRIGRINEEIQRELSGLLRTVKDPRVADAMLTITHVDTTGDLRYSRIYISAMDRTHEKDLMRGLKSAGGYLRQGISGDQQPLDIGIQGVHSPAQRHGRQSQQGGGDIKLGTVHENLLFGKVIRILF